MANISWNSFGQMVDATTYDDKDGRDVANDISDCLRAAHSCRKHGVFQCIKIEWMFDRMREKHINVAIFECEEGHTLQVPLYAAAILNRLSSNFTEDFEAGRRYDFCWWHRPKRELGRKRVRFNLEGDSQTRESNSQVEEEASEQEEGEQAKVRGQKEIECAEVSQGCLICERIERERAEMLRADREKQLREKETRVDLVSNALRLLQPPPPPRPSLLLSMIRSTQPQQVMPPKSLSISFSPLQPRTPQAMPPPTKLPQPLAMPITTLPPPPRSTPEPAKPNVATTVNSCRVV